MSTVSNFGGLWCSLEEEHYLTLVEKDLVIFSKRTSVNRVLIFPPLSSRFRFLIHKVVEQWPEFKSCSIGSEPTRRTVVYFKEIERIHKTKQFMDVSKVEAEQAAECSPRGRGRGRGVRNSPTASRRPPRALYTPGAFNKQRKKPTSTDSQEKQAQSQNQCSESISIKNTIPNSGIKTEPFNENSEIDKSQLVEKLNSKDQQNSESGLKSNENKRDSTLENVNSLEFDKLNISSYTRSSLVENRLNDSEEEMCVNNLPNDSTSEQIDLNVASKVYCTDSNCDISTPQSSVGHSIHSDCSVGVVNNTDVLSETDQKHRKSQDTDCKPFKKDIQIELLTVKDHVTNSSESSNSKTFLNQKPVSGITVDGRRVDERKSSSENERQLPGNTVGSVTEHLQANVELNDKDVKICLGNNECLISNDNEGKELPQSESKKCSHNVTNVNDKDAKKTLGSDEKHQGQSEIECPIIAKKELSDDDRKITSLGNKETLKVKAQSKKELECKQDDSIKEEDVKVVRANNVEVKSTGTLNDVEMEINKNVVDSESNNQVQSSSQSKSKRQSKKEEKAKKKEEKLKKKQVKTKSEKKLKKSGVEQKETAKESKVCEPVTERKNNKGVKTEHEKEKRADSDAKATASEHANPEKNGKRNRQDKEQQADVGGKELKVVRECKSTLLRVSVSEDLEDSGNDDSAEEDWETTWNDDGECLDADLLAELNEQIDTSNVEVVKSQFDYLSFKPNDTILDKGVFDHVVEIFDFSPEFKNHDLINALSKFQQQGFDIQWVDDTHALAVFSNHRTAQHAIEQCSNPMVKLRSVYEGRQQSKLKAKRSIDFLQPYKERPKTTNLVANRLVAGALGMRSKMSREERQLEREKIKAEREKKLTKEKQKQDLWNSDDL